MNHRDLTFGGPAGLPANLLVVGSASLLLPVITYRLVEVVALRLKSRVNAPGGRRPPAPPGPVESTCPERP